MKNEMTIDYNENDYMVINPDILNLDENQIAVGVKNFSKMGQDCLMNYNYDGKWYRRSHTDIIPNQLIGHVCSVQVYDLMLKGGQNEQRI